MNVAEAQEQPLYYWCDAYKSEYCISAEEELAADEKFALELTAFALEVRVELLGQLWPGGPNYDHGSNHWNEIVEKMYKEAREALKVPV